MYNNLEIDGVINIVEEYPKEKVSWKKKIISKSTLHNLQELNRQYSNLRDKIINNNLSRKL